MSVETEERLDLLDALVYGDAFDCAVTLDELWRYARVRVGREALRRLLDEDPVLRSVVVERDGLLCLAGREDLLPRRPARLARALLLRRRADRVARILRHVPFVRGLALTGSAAAGDAGEDADVDLLVIVERERLGTAFVLLATTSRVVGRRIFCPNHYVCADRLGFSQSNVYVARELAHARSLAGSPDVLRVANPWVDGFFPNSVVSAPASRESAGPHRLQKLLEAALGGRLGKRIERWGRSVAAARLRAHYGPRGVPSDVAASFEAGAALRFHRGERAPRALDAYGARRAQLDARLQQIDRERSEVSSTP